MGTYLLESHNLSKWKVLLPWSSILRLLLRNGGLFVIFLLSSFCEKDFDYESSLTPYADIEKLIRDKYDAQAVFSWDQYSELLAELSQNKFVVLPLNEMRNTYKDSKVVVGLRHDIDSNPFKALEMAKIESMLDIRASYYILATGEYSGSFENGQFCRSLELGVLYRELHKLGAEIGIHNDLLTIMIQYGIDPFIFNKSELSYYKSLRVPVYGTASHGSTIAKITHIPNYQIFSDFAKVDSVVYLGKKYPIGKNSLSDYGFKYEAYAIDYNIYLSDSGGVWNDPEGLQGILKKLEASKPGDRIQILVHPDWWGKKTN
jgi:hypothetical protein